MKKTSNKWERGDDSVQRETASPAIKILIGVIFALLAVLCVLIVLLILDGTGILYKDNVTPGVTITAPAVKGEDVIDSDIFQYMFLEDGSIMIISCVVGDEDGRSEVVVPSEIDGYKVTAISDRTFMLLNECVRTIRISEGITYIGANAFLVLGKAEVYLPKSVTEIQENAFAALEVADGETFYIEKVYYAGSAQDWSNVRIGSGNSILGRIIFLGE